MPHIKPKTCHKCHTMYTGWRCPRCYRKAHKASGNHRATLRTFQASSVLRVATTSPIVAHDIQDSNNRYNDTRICSCGFLTTTHPCSYCGKD